MPVEKSQANGSRRVLWPNRRAARKGNQSCFICRRLHVLPFGRCGWCVLGGLGRCVTITAGLVLLAVVVGAGVAAWQVEWPVGRTVLVMTALIAAILLPVVNACSDSHARTRARLARLHSELAEQHEFLQALSPLDSLPECLDHIVRSTAARLRCKRVSIMLADENGEYLSIAASCGVPEDVVKTTRIPIGQHIAGRVIQQGRTVHIKNAREERGPSALPIDSIAFMSGPLLLSGIHWGKTRLGVLSVTEPIGRKKFGGDDEFIFNNIRDASAVTIHNHLAVAQVRRNNVEFLKTLVNTIEARDKYTCGHSERVSRYAVAIGQRLMLGQKFLSQLRMAGQLHDIGKIGMTDAILQKSGALTEEEWQVMRRHTDIGAEMLAKASVVSSALDAIRAHHEHLDGSGYPHGLAGAQIPLPARIIGVADAFDAMTTERPYHEALSVSRALAELKCQRGKQFDAGCVDALIEAVNAGELDDLLPASQTARASRQSQALPPSSMQRWM